MLGLVLLVVGLFGCDHATKIAAKAALEGGGQVVAIAPTVLRGAVELRYVENDDVAFSALHHLGVPQPPAVLTALSVLAIAAVVALAIFGRRRKVAAGAELAGAPPSREERVAQVGFSFIIAGALGNVVDRMVRGYVVDFIHVRGWPVFNVADVVVVIGMALIALTSFRDPHLGGRALRAG